MKYRNDQQKLQQPHSNQFLQSSSSLNRLTSPNQKEYVQRISPSKQQKTFYGQRLEKQGFYQKSKALSENELKKKLEVIDIKQLQMAIKLAQKYITGLDTTESNVVIFIGLTGAGKSASITTMSGKQMVSYIGQDGEAVLIDKNHKEQNDADILSGKVRGGYISTKYSAGTIVPDYLPFRASKEIVLYDMPGFGDNRGNSQIIINAYYINRIFNLHKKVTLCFTISAATLNATDRAKNLIQSLQNLIQMFGSVINYKDSITLLVTRTKKKVTNKNIIVILKKLLEENMVIKSNGAMRQFLELIIKGKIPIILIPQPIVPDDEQITQKRPVIITNQYDEHIIVAEQTFKSLTPTRFQNIQCPKLSHETLEECKKFVVENEAQNNKLNAQVIEDISSYIENAFSSINFSHRIKNFKSLFMPISYVKKTMTIMMKIVTEGSSLKEKSLLFDKFKQYQTYCRSQLYSEKQPRFNKAMRYSQANQFSASKATSLERDYDFKNNCRQYSNPKQSISLFQYSYGVERLSTLEKYKNSIVMANFLSIFKFQSKKYGTVNAQNVIKQFFDNLFKNKIKFETKMKQLDKVVEKKIEHFLKILMEQYLQKMKKSEFYQHWMMTTKVFPSVCGKFTKYNSSKNSKEFISSMLEMDDQLGIGIGRDRNEFGELQLIKNLINDEQEVLHETPSMDFIRSEIFSKINQFKRTNIQETLNQENWDVKKINQNLIYLNHGTQTYIQNLLQQEIFKMEQTNHNLKKSKVELESGIEAKKKEIYKASYELQLVNKRAASQVQKLKLENEVIVKSKNQEIQRLKKELETKEKRSSAVLQNWKDEQRQLTKVKNQKKNLSQEIDRLQAELKELRKNPPNKVGCCRCCEIM